MAAIRQYPHYLFAVMSGANSEQDENGDWVPAETRNVLLSECREETNGRGSEVQVAGGEYRRFTSLVQMPKGVERIPDGLTVFVSDDIEGNNIRIKGSSLKFDSGQLHCRLWL